MGIETIRQTVEDVVDYVCLQSIKPIVMGGVGYGIGWLGNRFVTPLDPVAGVISGSVYGLIGPLFVERSRNHRPLLTLAYGINLLFFVPKVLCRVFNIPVTFKASLLLDGGSLLVYIIYMKYLNMPLENLLKELFHGTKSTKGKHLRKMVEVELEV